MKSVALLLLPLAVHAAAPASDWSPNLVLTTAWRNNASNGEAVWDRVDALKLGADVLASSAYAVSREDAFHLSLHLGGDWYPRFLNLDSAAGGARLDWTHTFGRTPLAPVFAVEAAGDYVSTVESAQRGRSGALTLKLAKRFGRSWHASLRERFDRYLAKSDVFDSSSNEASFEVGRDLNEATRIVASARWRDGDVVTYAQYHRPDLLAIARASTPVKTFHQWMTAYATSAHTVAGRIAIVHATSEAAAVELGYEYAETKRPALRFANQTVYLTLIRQY
ncbi:MAG TPA: hypothetical protein VHE61_11390 [Opitutaceae bacterium]|nr:hypothetical protein [Opitutaceae bacterium]